MGEELVLSVCGESGVFLATCGAFSFILTGDRADFAKEANFTNGNKLTGKSFCLKRADDSESNGEIRGWLTLDILAADGIYKNILIIERKPGVFDKDSQNNFKALLIDTLSDELGVDRFTG